MDTVVSIDGICYVFETISGRTRLRVTSETTPTTDTTPIDINLPHAWLITRRDGTPLFAIRPDECERPFHIITAEQLYEKKIQWFEPLADYYRELIWIHPDSSTPGSEVYAAYKHFTWGQIIAFAIVDRWSISFAKGFPGDWKANSEGGDGYLMVLVDGSPYWTDGVGQIPFSVDTFRKNLEELRDKSEAIRKTVQIGMKYGDGDPLNPADDSSNQYDNYMVLRGALWASDNFQLIITQELLQTPNTSRVIERTSTSYQPISMQHLQKPISANTASQYGEWKK